MPKSIPQKKAAKDTKKFDKSKETRAKKEKPAAAFVEGQKWKHNKTGTVITLGTCTKATCQFAEGTRQMRATTLQRDYTLVK